MGDGITHDHLSALADRLEGSFRREVDQLRTDVRDDFKAVHARVRELNDTVKAQNSRIGKSEQAIGAMQIDVREVQRAVDTHLDTHEVVAAHRQPAPVQEAPDPKPTGKAFVAGVTATILALTGLAHGAWDVLAPYLKAFLDKKLMP